MTVGNEQKKAGFEDEMERYYQEQPGGSYYLFILALSASCSFTVERTLELELARNRVSYLPLLDINIEVCIWTC